MKIDSTNIKIKDVFSRKKYIIPDYQRNYSWKVAEELSIFWDDLEYYFNDNKPANFFIGPMVFKGSGLNAAEFEVIDGQQRLITFSILLSTLIKKFEELRSPSLANGLKQYLIFKNEKNEDQLVIQTMESHPYYQNKIYHGNDNTVPKKDSEKLICEAWKFFYQKLTNIIEGSTKQKGKLAKLEYIRDLIFNIDTVIIVSDEEADAFTIFETINTRGINLTPLDLLKNYIFKNFSKKVGIEEPKETWKRLKENISIESESFFNRFWASWVAKVTENKLYRRFNDYMRLDSRRFEDANTLLDKLYKSSSYYRYITKPQIDDWKLNKNYHIYFHLKTILGLFKVKSPIPFFLALFEEFENGNITQRQLDNILLNIENFHFIFTNLTSSRPSGIDNKYSKYAIKLREAVVKETVLRQLKKELFEKLPSKEEYIESFKKLNYREKKETIKYILLRLEKEKSPSMLTDLEQNSIDHLLPVSSGISAVDSIGNLFLLEKSLNDAKSNIGPFTKLKNKNTLISDLKDSTRYITTKRELSNIYTLNKWTISEIENRVIKLANETYDLFTR